MFRREQQKFPGVSPPQRVDRRLPSQSQTHVLKEPSSTMQQQKMMRFTPAAIRQLMPRVRDEEEDCFRHNQRKCSEAIELECSQRRWETTYAVPDTDEYDVHVLEAVYKRLVQWLIDEKFDVQPESTRPRSFTVSWDPAQTLSSVTEEEKANLQSNAMIRLRTVERARGNTLHFSQQKSSTLSGTPDASRYASNRQQQQQQQPHSYSGTPATHSPPPPPAVYYMPAVPTGENHLFFPHNIPVGIDYTTHPNATGADTSALYNHWLRTATKQAAQMMAEQTWYPQNIMGSAVQQHTMPSMNPPDASLGDVVRSMGTVNAEANDEQASNDNSEPEQNAEQINEGAEAEIDALSNANESGSDVAQDNLHDGDMPTTLQEKPSRKTSPFAAGSFPK